MISLPDTFQLVDDEEMSSSSEHEVPTTSVDESIMPESSIMPYFLILFIVIAVFNVSLLLVENHV